jgi:Skp family chaperone for outer membrane proteins
MAETEVEIILREIRERVLAQQRSGPDVAATSAHAAANGANGAGDSGIAQYRDSQNLAAENTALINSYLTTTARAWDRLPPVVSNRSGFVARLELWLKRRLRAGTRWFTWEQVNFNAAVHHALRDLLPLLAAYEQELGKLRARIDAEVEARQTELTALRAEIEAQRIQVDVRLAESVRELRDRDERLQAEQRVCFKQLSLEASEAAVLEDRARRKAEALLEELSRRVEKLEK